MKSCSQKIVAQKQRRGGILRKIILVFFLVLCIGLGGLIWWIRPYVVNVGWKEITNANEIVHISKSNYRLELFAEKYEFLKNFIGISKVHPIKSFAIAIGLNPGDKQRPGDMRTPVGLFVIEEFYDSKRWTHDFKDGKGEIPNAYGPWFMDLRTGWDGIGIHGTHDDSSIGKMKTEGCIRLVNSNLLDLKNSVHKGTLVLITP